MANMFQFLCSQDRNGNTMLHICAQNNLIRMAEICIKHGCDINATNKKGLTPLDYCDSYSFNKLGDWFVAMGGENGHCSLLPVSNIASSLR